MVIIDIFGTLSNMAKFLILIFLLLSPFCTLFAKERELLKINTPSIVGIDNKKFYQTQITKMSQRMIWESNTYEILIAGKPKKALAVKNLELHIKKENGINTLNFSIVDESGRISNNAWAAGIPDRFVMLQARLSLYELFYGKQKLKKSLNKITKKENEKEEVKENKNTPGNDDADDSLTNEIRAILTSAGITTQMSLRPFSMSSSLSDNISFEDALFTINENIKKQKKKSKRASEFTINLKAMRIAIAMAIKSSKDENQKKKAASQDKESEKQNSEDSDIEAQTNKDTFPVSKKFDKGMRARQTRSIFNTAYMNINSTTNYLIGTTNNYNFFGLQYQYRKPLSLKEGHDFVFSGHYFKSIGSKAEEFDVPNVINLYLQYLFAPEWLPFDLFAGVHYENQPFINLPVLNQGLQSGENTLIWSQIGVERVFYIRNKRLITNLSYFKSISAESSFETENITSTKLFAQVEYDITQKYRVGLGGFKTTLNSSKLNIEQNVFMVTLNYTMK